MNPPMHPATTVHHFSPARRRNHLTLMSNDDHETTTTLAPPTDREAPTNPEASVAPIQALRPPPQEYDTSFLRQDDSTFSRAVKLIADAARALDADREERRLATAQAQSNHNAVIEAIIRADANSTRNYEMVRDEIRHLKDSDLKQDRRLAEGDQRFEKIEQSIAALKDELIALVTRATADAAVRIDALEQQLARAKNDAASQPPPAAPAG